MKVNRRFGGYKFSETWIDFHRRYIPEDRTLRDKCCENLKSYIVFCSYILQKNCLSSLLELRKLEKVKLSLCLTN
jgi:hypothetical protein